MQNLDWSLKITFEHCLDVQSLCMFVHWSRFNLCLGLSRGFVASLRQQKPISWRRRSVVAVETSLPKAQLRFWESWVTDENLLILAIWQSCLSSCGVVFFCFTHAAWPFKAIALMTWEMEALLQPTWLAISFHCFSAAWRERMRLLRLLVTFLKSFVCPMTASYSREYLQVVLFILWLIATSVHRSVHRFQIYWNDVCSTKVLILIVNVSEVNTHDVQGISTCYSIEL